MHELEQSIHFLSDKYLMAHQQFYIEYQKMFNCKAQAAFQASVKRWEERTDASSWIYSK